MLLALHNLVGNALKYTQSNGKVEVVVNVDDRLFSVQVKDTGIGISEADQEKIFDRFYRAKDPRVAKITGTGLGLTLRARSSACTAAISPSNPDWIMARRLR